MQAEGGFLAVKSILEKKGYIDIPSQGQSMYPVIGTGDVCRFIPFRENQVRLGDIILFVTQSGSLVGHRLCKIVTNGQELYYVCKGDSNLAMDSPIHPKQVLGRMVMIRKSMFRLQTDNLLMTVWGKLIVASPQLSIIIHVYLAGKRALVARLK